MLGSLSLTGFFALTVLLSMWLVLLVVKRTAPEWLARVAAGLVIWLGATALIGMSGYTEIHRALPPKLLQTIVFACAIAVLLATSSFGARLAAAAPLHLLVGLHTFRIMAAIFLFGGYKEGFVPWTLTWIGYNWDALTGMGALMLTRVVKRNPKARAALWIWNTMGMLLLTNCVFVTLLSMPSPFLVFDGKPDATFLTRSPFIWWPLYLIPLSAFGHIVILRRLAAERAGQIPVVAVVAGAAEPVADSAAGAAAQ